MSKGPVLPLLVLGDSFSVNFVWLGDREKRFSTIMKRIVELTRVRKNAGGNMFQKICGEWPAGGNSQAKPSATPLSVTP